MVHRLKPFAPLSFSISPEAKALTSLLGLIPARRRLFQRAGISKDRNRSVTDGVVREHPNMR